MKTRLLRKLLHVAYKGCAYGKKKKGLAKDLIRVVSGNEPAFTPEITAGQFGWTHVNPRQSETRLHKSVWHKLYFFDCN